MIYALDLFTWMKDIWHPADVESIKARLVVVVCLHHIEYIHLNYL